MTDDTISKKSEPANLHSLLGEALPPDLNSHDYHRFCREERNFAALLYHLLLQDGGIKKFMAAIKAQMPADSAGTDPADIDPANIRIYFEYAHARDLWHLAGKRTNPNQCYREAIIALLGGPSALMDYLRSVQILDFNSFFGASPKASEKSIQMPARWRMRPGPGPDWLQKKRTELPAIKPEEWLAFAKRAVILKWAFNVKPDLVIHTLPTKTMPTKAICIEAKLESKESVYSAELFNGETFQMRQTEIQRFVLEKLLGYRTQFVMLTKGPSTGKQAAKSNGAGADTQAAKQGPKWHDFFEAGEQHPAAEPATECAWPAVFDALSGPPLPPFVPQWLVEMAKTAS
ncbi:MAG: hypothetical protein AB7I68_14630 [Porticoccaceae bacterium]